MTSVNVFKYQKNRCILTKKKTKKTTILQANPIAKWIVVDSNRIIFRDM